MQTLKDFIGSHPSRSRIPQRERGNAIGVDVFRAFFKLGEAREVVSSILVVRVVDLEEYGSIALND